MSPEPIEVLRDILVVLVAAKVAAEIAERIGVAAVLGEILAGVAIGPSVLNWVGHGSTLETLAELGVILLLLEVGMEMDLVELGRVGKASAFVAIIGIIAPLGLGYAAMRFLGEGSNPSLFVGAALTATSVGITARVFGDLRALATTEARIVLGAAVADDVLGLIVLTVVVRLVTEGSVSALSLAGIIGVAVAFLLVGGGIALRIAPPLFHFIERKAVSTGTLVVLALGFTLAFSEFAHVAKLAPIIGAFLAGLALARSNQAERIRRELAPVGHLFIPVFFLTIGINVDIASFADATVLRDAAVLLVVAIVGKIVAPLGALGTPSDKVLIGIGMLPRGEVGLIFATIGLTNGVLSDDLYASLLVVVLGTTLITPLLLRWRYARLPSIEDVDERSDPEPTEGWLVVQDGTVVLTARPPRQLTLCLAFEAAERVTEARPSPELLDWLNESRTTPLAWSADSTQAFLRLLTLANGRSWRFLDNTGVLERVFPELEQTLRNRRADPFELDSSRIHVWDTVESLSELVASGRVSREWSTLQRPEWVMLAALLVDMLEQRTDRVEVARTVVERMQLGARAEEEIALLVEDPTLFATVASRVDARSEAAILPLAVHLGIPETVIASFVLAEATADPHDLIRTERRRTVLALVQKVLADPTVAHDARNLIAQRRTEATRLVVPNMRAQARIESAPMAYVLARSATELARHATLAAQITTKNELVVTITDANEQTWLVEIAARDRVGLLADVVAVFAATNINVTHAVLAGWDDGVALQSFVVVAQTKPNEATLRAAIAKSPPPAAISGVPDAVVSFDDGESPWYAVCDVAAPDRPGLLYAIAHAFTEANMDVHRATIDIAAGRALDRFEVTGTDGAKPSADDITKFVELLRDGSATDVQRRSRLWPFPKARVSSDA